MDEQVHKLGVVEIADAVRRGDLTAAEVLDAHLQRIAEYNAMLNAFVMVDEDRARATAAQVDAQVAEGTDPGPLAGVPFGIKCLEPVEGWPHTLASVVFKDRIATRSSTQVTRLLGAGAVPVGLTASPEAGTASHTDSALYGTTRSPWDLAKTPGGSSGGSSAAISAGLVPMATGSDSGGSLRIPAAYTGIVGFKGTYGRVPRGPSYVGMPNVRYYGVMARSVTDVAYVLDVIAGVDQHDPLSLPSPETPFAETTPTLALDGTRVTFSSDLGSGACEPAIEALAREGFSSLVAHAGLDEVSTHVDLPDCADSWFVLGTPDVAGLFREAWPACADDITQLLQDMLNRAPTLTSLDFAKASLERDALVHALANLFAETDVLITPTVGCPAFAAEGPGPSIINGREVGILDSVTQTYLFNLSGNPAISVPLGMVDGAPVGIHIIGRRHADALVLALGAAWERMRPWPLLASGY